MSQTLKNCFFTIEKRAISVCIQRCKIVAFLSFFSKNHQNRPQDTQILQKKILSELGDLLQVLDYMTQAEFSKFEDLI